MELELQQWGDGTTRLVYWDHEHGNDVVFVLGADGKAYRADPQEDESEILTEADLVQELRAMAAR